MNRRNLTHWLRIFTFLFSVSLTASVVAQNPYAGVYTGLIYLKNEGIVSLPEMSIGAIGFTIEADGTIRQDLIGPVLGTVSPTGAITFNAPISATQITSATITNDTIHGSHSITTGPLTQTYRIEAAKSGEIGEDAVPVVNFLTPGSLIDPNQTIGLQVVAQPATDYQWYRGTKADAELIAGATASFYTSDPLSETTTFWVRVFNGSVSTDSNEIVVSLREDPPAPWQKIPLPDPASVIHAVNGNTWVASVSTTDEETSFAHISEDGGETWRLLVDNRSLSDAFIGDDFRIYVHRNAISYENENGELINATITPFPGNIGKIIQMENGDLYFPSLQADGIFRSEDNGKNWNRIPGVGLPDIGSVYLYVGSVGNRLLVGASTRAAEPVGALYFSDDHGATFTKGQGLPVGSFGPENFGVVDGKLYAKLSSSFYVSEDEGVTWALAKASSLAQLSLVVEGERFYWAINGGLGSMASDMVDEPYTGPGADYPFRERLFYSRPYLIAQIGTFGWFKMELENIGTGGGDEEPTLLVREPAMFNPATGLYEQWIQLALGNVALPRFEIEVRGLPENVALLNASRRIYGGLIEGRREILGYVLTYLDAFDAGAELSLGLQFISENLENPAFTPQFKINTSVSAPSVALRSTITTQRIDRHQASFVFPVTPGKTYGFRWTTDFREWTNQPDFMAAGNLWEWLEEIAENGRYFQLIERGD